ncbi:hypothetical protein Hanom_Chr07g00674601 [Helianthus anomalus]
MLQDPIGIPSCFLSTTSENHHATITMSGQTLFMSVYKTQIAGKYRCITVTWFKHLLFQGWTKGVEMGWLRR